MIDEEVAERLEDAWTKLDRAGIPLEVIDVPDRRVVRAALSLASEVTADGETEVTILLPRPTYSRLSMWTLHDRVADRVAAAISELPHATATIVPFQLGRPFLRMKPIAAGARQAAGTGRAAGRGAGGVAEGTAASAAGQQAVSAARQQPAVAPSAAAADERAPATAATAENPPPATSTTTAGADTAPAALRPGRKVRVQGKLKSVTVRPVEGVPVLECALIQGESVVVLRFMGRRRVIGIRPGVTIRARGTVRSDVENQLVIDNPSYSLVDTGPVGEDE